MREDVFQRLFSPDIHASPLADLIRLQSSFVLIGLGFSPDIHANKSGASAPEGHFLYAFRKLLQTEGHPANIVISSKAKDLLFARVVTAVKKRASGCRTPAQDHAAADKRVSRYLSA